MLRQLLILIPDRLFDEFLSQKLVEEISRLPKDNIHGLQNVWSRSLIPKFNLVANGFFFLGFQTWRLFHDLDLLLIVIHSLDNMIFENMKFVSGFL